MHTVLAA